MEHALARRRRDAVPLLREALVGCRAEQENASTIVRTSLRISENAILGVLVQILPLDTDLPALLDLMTEVLDRQADVPGLPLIATSLADVLERRRAAVPDDDGRIALLDAAAPVLDRLVGVLLATGHPEAALVAAERARGRALNDLLSGATHAAVDAGSPPLSIDGIREAVAEIGTTVVYHLAPGAGHACVLTPDGTVSWRPLPGSSGAVVTALGSGRAAPGPHAIDRLRRLLVAPVEADLPVAGSPVVLVPHGPAYRVPFAALLPSWPLALLPSIATARPQRALRASSRLKLVVLVAPTMPPTATPLPALPDLRSSADAFARTFPGATTLLSGQDASLHALREAASVADVLVLATHGHADDEDPTRSFLALAPSDVHDGVVRLADLAELRLEARLVVLLACRTGAGRITGDGVMGMSRAFLAAGAQAVVATLWEVGERTTRRLVQDLLVLWSRGASPTVALHGAQRRARARHGPGQEDRWAGVVLYASAPSACE